MQSALSINLKSLLLYVNIFQSIELFFLFNFDLMIYEEVELEHTDIRLIN